MNQEILNKLHAVLYAVTPLALERERIIADMGEVIWLESLETILLALNEDKRKEVVELLNKEDIEKAIEIFEENDVDIEAIMTEVSISIMDEVMAAAK